MTRKHLIYTLSAILLLSFSTCRKRDRHRNRDIPEQKIPDTVILEEDEYDPIVIEETERELPTPPKIQYRVTQHSNYTQEEFFRSYNLSAEMQELILSCDYKDKLVRNTAVALAGHSPGEFNLGQICDIFDYCYANWKYVSDPVTGDYFSSASETLVNNLGGDCDDFAILVCSLILSIGGEARINFAYGDNAAHAFTEVNIGYTDKEKIANYLYARYGTEISLWEHKDNQGNYWLNLDWQAQHPGGKYWKYNHGTSFYIIQNYCERL